MTQGSPLPDFLTAFALTSWFGVSVSEGMGTEGKEKHTGTTLLLCPLLPVGPFVSFPVFEMTHEKERGALRCRHFNHNCPQKTGQMMEAQCVSKGHNVLCQKLQTPQFPGRNNRLFTVILIFHMKFIFHSKLYSTHCRYLYIKCGPNTAP